MNKEYCEKIRISAMAISDGDQPLLPETEIAEHIGSCAECRSVIEQLHNADLLLQTHKRRDYDVNVLDALEPVLNNTRTKQAHQKYLCHFIVFGLVLFALKIIEVAPVLTAGIIVKFLSLLAVVAFFIFLKQNPFTINQNFISKGDLS